jgi:phosphosulfolactate synthase (CoM biosynthesis protein A)
MGNYVDALKFAGGSFSLMPRAAVQSLIQYCHEHDVLVSTGGFIERVLTWGPGAVNKYIDECGQIGFDIVEISTGFIAVPVDDVLRLIEKVQRAGMKAKPEVGIQFGAGGTTGASELEAKGHRMLTGRLVAPDVILMRAHYGLETADQDFTVTVSTGNEYCA